LSRDFLTVNASTYNEQVATLLLPTLKMGSQTEFLEKA
jgi:hypothetical protein